MGGFFNTIPLLALGNLFWYIERCHLALQHRAVNLCGRLPLWGYGAEPEQWSRHFCDTMTCSLEHSMWGAKGYSPSCLKSLALFLSAVSQREAISRSWSLQGLFQLLSLILQPLLPYCSTSAWQVTKPSPLPVPHMDFLCSSAFGNMPVLGNNCFRYLLPERTLSVRAKDFLKSTWICVTFWLNMTNPQAVLLKFVPCTSRKTSCACIGKFLQTILQG